MQADRLPGEGLFMLYTAPMDGTLLVQFHMVAGDK